MVNDHTYWKNLAKIGLFRSPITGEVTTNRITFDRITISIGLEAILSWINVPFLVWQISLLLLSYPKSLMQKRPQKLEEISYPLRANVALSPEAVWARVIAISAVFGASPTIEKIEEELASVKQRVPDFNEAMAIQILRELGISGLKQRIQVAG